MSISLSISGSPVKSGKSGTAVIALATTGAPPAVALQFTVSYPSPWTDLSFAAGQQAVAAQKQVSANTGVDPAKVLVAGMNVNPIADGELAIFKFTVPRGFPRGKVTLTVADVKAADSADNPITATGGSGDINIVSPFDIWPKSSPDGLVDSGDFGLAVAQAIGLDAGLDADFNTDGVVDIFDVMALVIRGIIGNE